MGGGLRTARASGSRKASAQIADQSRPQAATAFALPNQPTTFPMTNHTAMKPKASLTHAARETEDAPEMSATELAFAHSRARLDQHFPDEPCLPDSLLAGTLGMTQNPLANRCSLEPARCPGPIELGVGRTGMHPRGAFIDWLARAEQAAKAHIVHRCR